MIILSKQDRAFYENFLFERDDWEKRNIERIKHPIDNDWHNRAINLKSLASVNGDRGILVFYLQHDIVAAKQWFYLSALLRAKSCESPAGGWDMNYPFRFIFALLSDNVEIIKTYSQLDTANDYRSNTIDRIPLKQSYDLPAEGRFYTLLMQHLLRKDWATIEQMYQTFNQKIKKKNPINLDEFDFYFALRDGNTDKMQQIITKYLQPRLHKAFNKDMPDEFSGRFWSHRPTIYTKLAWMFGYELEIKHDLLPMELMPIKPLAHYDKRYDFFADDFDWTIKEKKSFWKRLFRS